MYSYSDSGTRRRAGTRANGLVARAHRENRYHILLPSTLPLHYLYLIAIFSYTRDTCHTCSTLDCVNDDHHLPVKVCATKCPQLPGATAPSTSVQYRAVAAEGRSSALQRCEIEAELS